MSADANLPRVVVDGYDHSDASSGEDEFDSEDEAIADRLWGRDPGDAPRTAEDTIEFDAKDRCTHRVLRPDPRQEYFQRCYCTKQNYATCEICRVLINLSYTEILWPHTCMGCDVPLCVLCANRCARVDYDENIDRIYCDACIAKMPNSDKRAAVNWCVVYHLAQTDRDRRLFLRQYTLPFQLESYGEARAAAIEGLSSFGVGPLWDHIAKVLDHAFSACGDKGVVYDIDTGELLNGDDTTTALVVHLSRLHPRHARILAPPSLEDAPE